MTNRFAFSVLPLLLAALAVTSCSGSKAELTERDLEGWLLAYGAAWESRNSAAAASLFTDDATYQESPYAEPFIGTAEISEYWTTVTSDQEEIDFDFETVAVNGNQGVALWSAQFRSISGNAPVELNGVFVLEFVDASLVSSLREWWHVR